ncbi:MAG: hypothetical protein HS126_27250 [Anaerolineales bacterium]|nr:hypothetical protein [Anaerolineales bacterium]
MKFQWNHLAFWVGAVLLVVLVTVFYQPATAKTGSLLVWQDGEIYVLDIDSLRREPVGPAAPAALILPSPGCLGQVKAPCWVAVGPKIYSVGDSASPEITVPGEVEEATLSWSPDGLHLAYIDLAENSRKFQLRIFNAATGQGKILAIKVDPAVTTAWSRVCAAGLMAPTCQLGYKAAQGEALSQPSPRLLVPAWAGELRPDYVSGSWSKLVTVTPLTGVRQSWPVPVDSIFELRWTADNALLYSQFRNYFHRAQDYGPAYQMSPGSQLANMSPNARYTVYYEPFTQKECQAERPKGGCWYLGIWLADNERPKERQLIFSRELSKAGEGKLNADPFWSPAGDAFGLFREGNLVYYDLKQREAAIWYQSLAGQLTSPPVFSPHEKAIALVTQPAGSSTQYHLLVLNPQFKPLEHLIEAQQGFRVLAWLPHYS